MFLLFRSRYDERRANFPSLGTQQQRKKKKNRKKKSRREKQAINENREEKTDEGRTKYVYPRVSLAVARFEAIDRSSSLMVSLALVRR